jgi:TIR domain
MHHSANRVFISYRRDDAAGYAGRLEEALERRLGHGSVFRDVLDIAPGEDFVHAIRTRLGGARTVLVLIGPRWAGGDVPGTRRIDDAQDFVRLEVAVALDSGAQVVPVLLPGAEMPAEHSLPEVLKPLARRNALSLGDAHWAANRSMWARRCWPPRWWAVGACCARRLFRPQRLHPRPMPASG